MSRLLLFLALCLLLPTRVAAEPRAVAGRVADVIEREYFDPAQAKAIADELRDAARQGDFDALAHPQELAKALTTRLRSHDRHFNLRWRGSGDEASAASPARAAGVPDGARDNFGIRQVQRLPGNLGYLDLRVFADFDFDQAQAPARQAIDAMLQLLAHADALLIDLRDNGGGSPAMVGYLASAFLPPGRDVYNRFHSREGVESEAPATPYPHPRTALPIYVLVSGRTGSAAEAFAYTLQQAGRAQVVGEATGGAANPGRPFDAGEGFSVFVSTGTPRNPVSGRNWEGAGVQPDVATASADALDAATRLALETLLARGEEQEVRWALEALDAGDSSVRADVVEMLAGDYVAVRVGAEGATLQLRQGRRPALRLRPLSETLYYIEGDPARRVRFERDGAGVRALELLWADGQLARHLRGGVAGGHLIAWQAPPGTDLKNGVRFAGAGAGSLAGAHPWPARGGGHHGRFHACGFAGSGGNGPRRGHGNAARGNVAAAGGCGRLRAAAAAAGGAAWPGALSCRAAPHRMKDHAMKPRFAHVIWPAGLALGLAAASLAWSQDQTQAARAQVTAAERAFARTMADRSLEDFAGYLSEEATFFGQETLRGKREVVAGWAPFFEGAQAPFSWEPDQVEVLASGTLALSTGPVRDPNGKVVARFNSVWRQEGPGVWRVVFDKGSPPDPGGP